MAHNLTVTGIAHGYWTARIGNGIRLALWVARRAHAAPFLRAIAPRHDEKLRPALLRAADAFERETGFLREASAQLPPGEEAPHWQDDRIVAARGLLAKAEAAHGEAMNALGECAPAGGLAAGMREILALTNPDELQKRVGVGHTLLAEAALATLVQRAPVDLDQRLAALWRSLPDERKSGADGPIHRQLLFALARLETAVATEAIGRAVQFEGKCDDVPHAISRWAAEMTWKRLGEKSRDVFLGALDSPSPVVRNVAVPYIGRLGDRSLLPKLKGMPGPAVALARALLGDEAAPAELFDALSGPEWYPAYTGLLELGARAEPEARARLTAGPKEPQVVTVLGVLLSKVGGADSLAAVKKAAADHPEIPRLAQAVQEMENRLGGGK